MYNGPLFYPDPIFGWISYAVLLGFLAVATYTDVRTLVIPKTLTLPMLGVGLIFSVVRGFWMGSVLEGSSEGVVWHFARSPWLGMLDGFLCALEGFLAAFILFFVLWRLRVKRGGDVKLVAALGVWLGPVLVMLVVLATIPVLLLLGTALMIRKVMRRGAKRAMFDMKPRAQGGNVKKGKATPQRSEIWLAYSLPVAIATALVLLYPLLHDQEHRAPAKAQASEQASVQP